jgi:hypothetical protein
VANHLALYEQQADALLAGLLVGSAILSSANAIKTAETSQATLANIDSTKAIGQMLFTKYLFGFEALGVLLMVVAVGAVALARSKAGTVAVAAGPRSRLRLLARLVVLAVRPVAAVVVAAPA